MSHLQILLAANRMNLALTAMFAAPSRPIQLKTWAGAVAVPAPLQVIKD
ncbi:hypothetical protein [Deinococcus yunweiensis]